MNRAVEVLHALSQDLRDIPVPVGAARPSADMGRAEEGMPSKNPFKSVLQGKIRAHPFSIDPRFSETGSETRREEISRDPRDVYNGHRTFEEAREALTAKFPKGNINDAQLVFVPRFVVREIFCRYPDDVKSLYCLAASNDPKDRSARAETAQQFYHAIIGPSATGTSGTTVNDSLVIPEERGLSVILAMLLWQNITPATESWKRFEQMCVTNEAMPPPINDACLPMERQDLEQQFGKSIFVERLCEVQYTFRPLVLEKHKFVPVHEHQRIPFLQDGQRCGRAGSAGVVFKCIIPRGHLESRASLNKRSLMLARKEFLTNAQGNQAARLEQCIHEKFMLSSVTRHTHIMQPIASLRQGPKINFFFELARCDLLDYMKKGPNGEGDGSAPHTDEDKLRILQQFIHLASALEFLHNGIQAPGYDRVICYHLDLKPENILVVPNKDPTLGDVFKISDFGISRVHYLRAAHKAKINPDGEFGLEISPYDSAGATSVRDDRTQSDLHESSTYISPEGLALGSRVSTSSDVWAFGCILCTLLSWLHGGWKGVEKFSNQRKDREGRGRDYFFLSKPAPDATSNPEIYVNEVYEEGQRVNRSYHLNPAVNTLFHDNDGLIGSCNNQPKQAMYQRTWKLLQNHLLQVDPGKRQIRMGKVREKLQKLVKVSGGIDQFEVSACQPQ